MIAEWSPAYVTTVPTTVDVDSMSLFYEDGMHVAWRDTSDLGAAIKHGIRTRIPAVGDANDGHVLVALGIDGEEIDEVWTDGGAAVDKVRKAIESLIRLEAALTAAGESTVTAIDVLRQDRRVGAIIDMGGAE